jgi:hypothetical protein
MGHLIWDNVEGLFTKGSFTRYGSRETTECSGL